MKRSIYIILVVPILLLALGCEEASLLLGNNIFNSKYALVDSNVPPAQVKLWAEAPDPNPLNGDIFSPVPDPTTNLNPDRILLFGDPNSNQSSIEIHMNRGSGGADHLNTITLSVQGPFVEDQEITDALTAEITMGGLPNQTGAVVYNMDNTPDTYFSFTVTNINTTTNTVGGNFHMLLTQVGNRSADPVSVYEGAFSWNLD